jgi:hypothetical protein
LFRPIEQEPIPFADVFMLNCQGGFSGYASISHELCDVFVTSQLNAL